VDKFYLIIEAIENDVQEEGIIGNCRWIYNPTDHEALPGVLSLSPADTFDRWACDSLIDLNTICWYPIDFSFIKKVISVF